MSWATQTFTTIDDLLKLESEITRLTSTGTASYIGEGVSIAAAAPEFDSITVSRGDEVVAIAATQLTVKDGEELTIYLVDSDDDTTFANIATGNVNYSVTPSGGDLTVTADTELFRWIVTSDTEDYLKAVATSAAVNSGTISIYSTSKWADKISVAKDYMAVDIELMLINNGFRDYVDYSAGDEPKDLITNLSIFDMASHMKTLELIFFDLARGDEDSIFWHKMVYYREMYKLHLDKAWELKNIDVDLDGDTDNYRDKTENTRSFTR
jgi:hypothetical protein